MAEVYDFETGQETDGLSPETEAIKEESLVQLKAMMEELDGENFGPQEKAIIVSILADQCEQITEMFIILEFSMQDRGKFIEMMRYMIEQAIKAIEIANKTGQGEMQ